MTPAERFTCYVLARGETPDQAIARLKANCEQTRHTWHPIASAPPHGHILLGCVDGLVAEGWRFLEDEPPHPPDWWHTHTGPCAPTHWRLMPEPPRSDAK